MTAVQTKKNSVEVVLRLGAGLAAVMLLPGSLGISTKNVLQRQLDLGIDPIDPDLGLGSGPDPKGENAGNDGNDDDYYYYYSSTTTEVTTTTTPTTTTTTTTTTEAAVTAVTAVGTTEAAPVQPSVSSSKTGKKSKEEGKKSSKHEATGKKSSKEQFVGKKFKSRLLYLSP